MPLASLRRLALSDLNEETLRRIVEHGEDLFVERKRSPPPPPKFGAEVASFANTLGGWLLLGVDDADRKVVGYEPGAQLDLQSHLGNLLRNEVDPVPPFVADTFVLDGQRLGVVRIFESADAPVVVRGTGAVYVRDAGGKQPVTSHATLVELARRGGRARRDARERLATLPLIAEALGTRAAVAGGPPHELQVVVRLAPVTVSDQFAPWVLSRGHTWARELASQVLPPGGALGDAGSEVQPHGRGVVAVRWAGYPARTQFVVALDAGGVAAARLSRQQAGGGQLVLSSIARDVATLLGAAAQTLGAAEALGVAEADVLVGLPQQAHLLDAERSPMPWTHMSGSLTIPHDGDELRALAASWEREFARSAGLERWEPADARR